LVIGLGIAVSYIPLLCRSGDEFFQLVERTDPAMLVAFARRFIEKFLVRQGQLMCRRRPA
jgi:hypothetical protein